MRALCAGTVGAEAGRVGWGQITEGSECRPDACELSSVGDGEPLQVLEPQNGMAEAVLEEDESGCSGRNGSERHRARCAGGAR